MAEDGLEELLFLADAPSRYSGRQIFNDVRSVQDHFCVFQPLLRRHQLQVERCLPDWAAEIAPRTVRRSGPRWAVPFICSARRFRASPVFWAWISCAPQAVLAFLRASRPAPDILRWQLVRSHDGCAVARTHGEKIDLLFIDGDHSLQGVAKDFAAYRGFVRDGGIIASSRRRPGLHDQIWPPHAPLHRRRSAVLARSNRFIKPGNSSRPARAGRLRDRGADGRQRGRAPKGDLGSRSVPRVLVVNDYSLSDSWRAARERESPAHFLYGVDHLQAHGFDVDIVPDEESPWLAALDRRMGRLRIPFGSLDRQASVLRRLARADVIYTPCQTQIQTLTYLRAAGIVRVPIVCLAHHPLVRGRTGALIRPLTDLMLRGLSAMPALSEAVAVEANALAHRLLARSAAVGAGPWFLSAGSISRPGDPGCRPHRAGLLDVRPRGHGGLRGRDDSHFSFSRHAGVLSVRPQRRRADPRGLCQLRGDHAHVRRVARPGDPDGGAGRTLWPDELRWTRSVRAKR